MCFARGRATGGDISRRSRGVEQPGFVRGDSGGWRIGKTIGERDQESWSDIGGRGVVTDSHVVASDGCQVLQCSLDRSSLICGVTDEIDGGSGLPGIRESKGSIGDRRISDCGDESVVKVLGGERSGVGDVEFDECAVNGFRDIDNAACGGDSGIDGGLKLVSSRGEWQCGGCVGATVSWDGDFKCACGGSDIQCDSLLFVVSTDCCA